MTTTTSSAAYTGPVAAHGPANTMQVAYATIPVASTLGLNDILNMFWLPPNARIHGAVLKSSDIDTGSAAITLDVGDSGSATRYFSASTAGQAGTVDVTMAAAGRFFKTTAKTAVFITVHAAATTPAAGTVELAMNYVVEDSATS